MFDRLECIIVINSGRSAADPDATAEGEATEWVFFKLSTYYLFAFFFFCHLLSFQGERVRVIQSFNLLDMMLKCLGAFLLLLVQLCLAACPGTCSAKPCPLRQTAVLGRHIDLVGPNPACPERQVATVTAFRVESKSNFQLITSNLGGSIVTTPYIYTRATNDTDMKCYEQPDLPIIGDASQIQVTLNCEDIVKCDFEADISFGCMPVSTVGVQVISDIDDTIVCPNPQCDSLTSCATSPSELSHFLAGVDKRLKSKEIYPGSSFSLCFFVGL